MRIFILLRSNENFGDFTGEMRMRIFNLLGSEKLCGEEGFLLESKFRTLGEKAYSCLEKVQEFGLYTNLLGIPTLWRFSQGNI